MTIDTKCGEIDAQKKNLRVVGKTGRVWGFDQNNAAYRAGYGFAAPACLDRYASFEKIWIYNERSQKMVQDCRES